MSQRPSSTPKPVLRNNSGGKKSNDGGSGSGRGGKRGGGHEYHTDKPTPWLGHPLDPAPSPDSTAGFIEYLRWMRAPEGDYKDGTKLEIMSLAEKGDYQRRLEVLTQRTRLMAQKGLTFEVTCPWRIRVGGSKGPESMLLPAFDSFGIPYIPSSTLRGIARTQAIREFRQEMDWKEADKAVASFFGHLEAEDKQDLAGKVIFLDAYPLPGPSKSGGLAIDITNNIWKWEDKHKFWKYNPNPNNFFSLEKPTFAIGLCPTKHCQPEILERVKAWLCKGLEDGIGSQVNTGYGSLVQSQTEQKPGFFEVDFSIYGQLIHGHQSFTEWKWNDRKQKWEHRGLAASEVRPIAFKSMLRYWFRAFALGVLPTTMAKQLEAQLFGAIDPQKQGALKVQIIAGQTLQKEARLTRDGKRDPRGEQEGTLALYLSQEADPDHYQDLHQLFKHLTWFMFHLGGIGQGARRPCYSRKQAPWWRGTTLVPDGQDEFWKLPKYPKEFQKLFHNRLIVFFKSLEAIANQPIDPTNPLTAEDPNRLWCDAIDLNCQIIACTGEEDEGKPYALYYLHSYFHDLEEDKRFHDAKSLCGGVKKDKVSKNGKQIERDVEPSPIWIASHKNYQIVTVFGAKEQPRRNYINAVLGDADSRAILWPLK